MTTQNTQIDTDINTVQNIQQAGAQAAFSQQDAITFIGLDAMTVGDYLYQQGLPAGFAVCDVPSHVLPSQEVTPCDLCDSDGEDQCSLGDDATFDAVMDIEEVLSERLSQQFVDDYGVPSCFTGIPVFPKAFLDEHLMPQYRALILDCFGLSQ
jgi:hypothetical protein